LAAGIAGIVMAALTITVIVFASAAATGTLVGGGRLGDLFLSLCVSFTDLQLMLKGLGVIVVTGAGYFGALYIDRRKTAILVVTGLALGIFACLWLLVSLSNDDLVKNVFQPSEIGGYVDETGFRAAAKPMVIWAGAALTLCLSAFLGFSRPKGDRP
jgi:hypothetical protein